MIGRSVGGKLSMYFILPVGQRIRRNSLPDRSLVILKESQPRINRYQLLLLTAPAQLVFRGRQARTDSTRWDYWTGFRECENLGTIPCCGPILYCICWSPRYRKDSDTHGAA
jgi:hypothetical protein